MSDSRPQHEPFASIAPSVQGAVFVRADMHIHSYGVSSDVRDVEMTPEAIVKQAKARGIGMISITDHNAIDSVEAGLAAGAAHDVFVVPGVELTSTDGHLLVYFAPEDLQAFKAWFGRLTFEEDDAGDRCILQQIHRLADEAVDAGGIAVPAHVGRSNTGCLTKAPRKAQDAILASPSVAAIEVDGPSEFDWFDRARDSGPGRQVREEQAKHRLKKLGDVAGGRLARLYFSDAHELSQIGRNRDGEERLTRIKMSERSFASFRKALYDPQARVRLEDELPGPYPRLVGARMIGGFLDGEEIPFSPNLTCLIGGRGAGKSTVLEAVRSACLSVAPPPNRRSEDRESGWPQTVQLIFEDQFGARHFLERPAGGQTTAVVDDAAVPMTLPIEGYAQDDIAEIIRAHRTDAGPLTKFLDKFADLESVQGELVDLREQLAANASLLTPVSDAGQRKSTAQALLKETQAKLKAVEKSKLKEALNFQRLILEERVFVNAVDARTTALERQITAMDTRIDVSRLLVEAGVTDPSSTSGKKHLIGEEDEAGIIGLAEAFERDLKEWQAAGERILADHLASIRGVLANWRDFETRVNGRIQQIAEELRAQGISADLAQLKRLAQQESEAKAAIVRADKDLVTLKQLSQLRRKLLDEYRSAQQRRFFLREQAAKDLTSKLNKALVEFKLKISYAAGADVTDFEAWVRKVTGLRALKGPRMTSFFVELLHQSISLRPFETDLGRQ